MIEICPSCGGEVDPQLTVWVVQTTRGPRYACSSECAKKREG